MKKKLLALAVAGAFVAPVAMADTSNVTVYGIADASVDFTKNGDTTGSAGGVNTHKISSNSSRIGLKGSEDLGSGLKAIWQIETQVDIDNSGVGGNGLATRNTFAGLAGDSWGSVTLGRNDTPYKSATRGLDVFMDHIADNRTLMGGARNRSSGSFFDGRNTDTVRYDSPDMNGFKVAAAYTAAAEGNTLSTSNVKGKVESLSGTYSTGPFFGALAYQKNTFGSMGTALSNIGGIGPVGAIAAGGAPTVGLAGTLTDEKAWKLGGGYKVDQFTVNAVYEKTTDNLGSTGYGHKAYYVAGAFNATANDTIKASYTKARNLGDGNIANSGAKQWAIGVDHSLSKRTTVYAMYTKLDNDTNAGYNLSATPVATGATSPSAAGGLNADPSAFSFGMKHSF